MLSCSKFVLKKFPIRNSKIGLSIGAKCSYHSYPDPNEKPVVDYTHSSAIKQILNKNSSQFTLDKKFSMDSVFPGVPVSKGITIGKPPKTISTTLPNGLVVATQEMPGLMSSFAFMVRTGSSFEAQSGPNATTGVTHFLELNSYRTTKNREHMQLVTEMENLGGMVQCLSTRENILYCVDVLSVNLEKALDILADAVLNPVFPEEEVEESKDMVQFQFDELPGDTISRDLCQMAAYQGYPLGNSHYAPLDQVANVNSKMLQDFRKTHFIGGNCIVSAAGVDHDSFVKLVQDKFKTLPAGSRDNIAHTRKESKYTGGMLTQQRTLKEPYTKVAMAWEVGGWADEDLVATCVMMQLLGGGSSFSAGGPGKGMYTRLYTQVLNRNHWAESVEAFVSIHDTHGIMGIDGSCPPEYVSSLIRTITDQFVALAFVPVTDIELSRAKNMLKSMMMMQMESRLVTCEDIGRQYITFGKRDLTSEVCHKIDMIAATDLMRVANKMLHFPPTVSCVGEDISHMPLYQDIATFVKNTHYDIWKKSPKGIEEAARNGQSSQQQTPQVTQQ